MEIRSRQRQRVCVCECGKSNNCWGNYVFQHDFKNQNASIVFVATKQPSNQQTNQEVTQPTNNNKTDTKGVGPMNICTMYVYAHVCVCVCFCVWKLYL